MIFCFNLSIDFFKAMVFSNVVLILYFVLILLDFSENP